MPKHEPMPVVLSYEVAATKSSAALFSYYKTSNTGLAAHESIHRLDEYGSNEITTDDLKWYHVLFRQFHSSFVYLLATACILSAVIGDHIEATMIGIFLGINITLGFVQEMRALAARKKLRHAFAQHVHAKRDGALIEIDSMSVVPGDIVVLSPGDIVPADGVWIRTSHLEVDESVLTGESVPITKNSSALSRKPRTYYAATNVGFSQTKIAAGKGELLITSTGNATIAGSLFHPGVVDHEPSEFEEGIQRLSTALFGVVIVTIIALLTIKIALHQDTNVVELVVFAIALLVGAVPEALPFVTTVSMSRGAIALAKQGVIVKRLSVIEDLGSVDVLCTDKTGTLTENDLTIGSVWGNKKETLSWARYGSWDGDRQDFKKGSFDQAIVANVSKADIARYRKMQIEYSLPFDPATRIERMAISDGSKQVHIIRGVPELFFPQMTSARRSEAEKWLSAEGKKGRRVLAIAVFHGTVSSVKQLIKDATCVGMISFEDPLKKGVKDILKRAAKRGVQVLILSGDAPDVVGYVASKTGLIDDASSVVTGEQFVSMNAADQRALLSKRIAFARVMPLQKLEIIEQLKAHGHVVGFLGDGFNDAPGLRLAHVGMAVSNASETAKDSAPIILTHKDLGAIIQGIQEGRLIFGNTITYIRATLTSNFGNFYALAFATLTLPWLPLLPVQILLLNLLTDGPMVAIAADRKERSSTIRPQRYHVRDIVIVALILGLVSTAFDFGFFGYFVGKGEDVLRTMWFMGSVLTELVLLFSIRTMRPFWKTVAPAPILMVLSVIAAAIAIGIPYTRLGHIWLGFTSPTTANMIAMVILVGGYFAASEAAKLFVARLLNRLPRY